MKLSIGTIGFDSSSQFLSNKTLREHFYRISKQHLFLPWRNQGFNGTLS